jgi:tetratricopeptide (TPR) repeat protein
MRSSSVFVTACLAAACAVPQAWAQPSANAEICVAADAGAYSPEQRIAACTALIDAAKDEPGELAPALINRGSVYYYINKMPAALADFDRAIALDPKNAPRLPRAVELLPHHRPSRQSAG